MLIASTFLGGSGGEGVSSIAIDANGNVYVAGATDSPDFPTTLGAFQTNYSGLGDAFVAKLSSDLSTLIASTYLGGSDIDSNITTPIVPNDAVHSIAVDANGNVYVAGWTFSSDFPTTSGASQTNFGGWRDAFVAKLSSDLSTLIASTFLGGSDSEGASSIAIDVNGNVYVAGWTFSSDFPTTSGAFQTDLNGINDAFVVKFDADLSGGNSATATPTNGTSGCSTSTGVSLPLFLLIPFILALRRFIGR